MSWTPQTSYAEYIQNLMYTTGRNAAWLKTLADQSGVDAQAGVVSVPIPTAFTPVVPAANALLASALNNTYVAMTPYDYIVPMILLPSVIKSTDWTPQNMGRIEKQAIDALQSLISAQIIADLVAATPGYTVALTTAKIDFVAATQTEIGILDRGLAYILANTGANISDLFILMCQAALGNFMAARNALIGSSFVLRDDNILTYNGIPIYPVAATSTNWGGASKACAYIVAPGGYSLAMTDAYPATGTDVFWQFNSATGMYYHEIAMTWQGKVTLAGAIAEIANPAS